ncbi:hypothetical protein ACX0G9_03555 [Flavitalea flava]
MQPKLIPALFFITLTVVSYGIFLRGLRMVLGRTSWERHRQNKIFTASILLVAGWAILLSVLSLRGFFADFSRFPPRLAPALVIPLVIVLTIAFSKTGKELLKNTPPQWLIYLQTFRVLVEIVIWILFMKGLLPVQMSFEGRNFDVLSGLLAIPVGFYCLVKKSWSPRWILVYNIAGLLLLINIVRISVLSMPTPFRYFHNEPASTLIVEFPFVFLPGLLVTLAYTLHIFSLRQYAVTRSNK